MIVTVSMLLTKVHHLLAPTCVSVANPAAAAADAWPLTVDPGSGIALICTVALEVLLESHQMPPIAAMMTVTADMGRSANDSAITTTLASTPTMLLLLSETPASFKIAVAPGVAAFARPTPILMGVAVPARWLLLHLCHSVTVGRDLRAEAGMQQRDVVVLQCDDGLPGFERPVSHVQAV